MDYQSQSEAAPVVAREHEAPLQLLAQEAEMADESGQEASAGKLRGRAVEQAAVDFVMEYERSHGREPTDRRYERAFAGDIKSPPRVIEIKATATSYRGWFLPLEPIQAEHAANDPDFYVYVVENVGQGDPSQFTLRVLASEHLRRLVSRATERRAPSRCPGQRRTTTQQPSSRGPAPPESRRRR